MKETLSALGMAMAILYAAILFAQDKPAEPEGTPQPPAPARPASADKITLKDGRTLAGEIVDITAKKIVIHIGEARRIFPREDVTAVERSASPSLLALFERKFTAFAASGSIDDWKGLATFCGKEKLVPERRRALREIIRLDPASAEAHAELGQAQLDDRWLDEDEVEAKRNEGYEVVGGKLIKSATGTAVKKSDARNNRYNFLPRTALSAIARKKMAKEREDRLKSADKFLEMKEKEYQGVDWTKRHIVKTRHFEVHCNSTRKVAEAYGVLIELIREKLSGMFQSTIQRNLRAAVNIYASQEDFMSLDRLGRGMGRGVGGYYSPPTQSISAFHGTFGFTGTTFSVLCHEGTHYYEGLVLKDFSNVPVWLIEGLAVYFGDGSIFDPKTVKITIGLIPRDRLAHIQEKMLYNRHTPIAKLVVMPRPLQGTHYADAWSLIHFLVNSGDKGKDLLKSYWKIGLEQPLKKEHFTELAKKYFTSLENMEKQWIDYTLKLDMPPAGRIVGDYFVSDSFQFDFKAPGDEWEFFEDKDDKRMLIGLVLPGTSAEVRIYYTNNDSWEPADKYFEAYQRFAEAKYKGFKHEIVKSGKLDWYKVTYLDEKKGPGATPKQQAGEDKGKEKDKEKEKGEENEAPENAKQVKRGVREVTRFFLIQVDGVVVIECAAKQGEGSKYEELFSKMNENFTLCFARRW